jgi:hypothetical protein
MGDMINEHIRNAEHCLESKQLDDAKRFYEVALNVLEFMRGLDDTRTIKYSIAYANVLYEIGIGNGLDKNLVSTSSQIYKNIIKFKSIYFNKYDYNINYVI